MGLRDSRERCRLSDRDCGLLSWYLRWGEQRDDGRCMPRLRLRLCSAVHLRLCMSRRLRLRLCSDLSSYEWRRVGRRQSRLRSRVSAEERADGRPHSLRLRNSGLRPRLCMRCASRWLSRLRPRLRPCLGIPCASLDAPLHASRLTPVVATAAATAAFSGRSMRLSGAGAIFGLAPGGPCFWSRSSSSLLPAYVYS